MIAVVQPIPGWPIGAVRILRRLAAELEALECELDSLQGRFAHNQDGEGGDREVVARSTRVLMGDLRREIIELTEVQSRRAPPSMRLLENLDRISAALAILQRDAIVAPQGAEDSLV